MWRDFSSDDSCNSCALCEKLCPTDSIKIISGKPQWSASCEQCMRCVNYCPKKAIYQKSKGSMKDRDLYHEPTFNPLKMRR